MNRPLYLNLYSAPTPAGDLEPIGTRAAARGVDTYRSALDALGGPLAPALRRSLTAIAREPFTPLDRVFVFDGCDHEDGFTLLRPLEIWLGREARRFTIAPNQRRLRNVAPCLMLSGWSAYDVAAEELLALDFRALGYRSAIAAPTRFLIHDDRRNGASWPVSPTIARHGRVEHFPMPWFGRNDREYELMMEARSAATDYWPDIVRWLAEGL